MPRTATVGPAIMEAVEKLVSEGKTRTEAFNQVAKDRNMKPGSVAANFYRVQRTTKGNGSNGNGRRRNSQSRQNQEASAETSTAPAAEAKSNNGLPPGAIDLAAEVQRLVEHNLSLMAENKALKEKLVKVESALV